MKNIFNIEQSEEQRLTRSDFAFGTIISSILLIIWTFGSSGMSLIATFVPGLILAWILYAYVYFGKISLPDPKAFIPIYYLTLGWQFIHFAEEYMTNFKELFPQIYGGQPYSGNVFVAFNMVAYLVFTASPIMIYYRGLRFFLVPALFFIVYGSMGNAIAHSWWSIYLGKYFPGLYTAMAYWLLGPTLIAILLKSTKLTTVFITIFTGVLLLTLTFLLK